MKTNNKIVPHQDLAKLTQELHHSGKKIVFTNGCFDILHVGHIHYLEKARSLGDVLIVGVNSDNSVRNIKGITRPINPEQERLTMIAALESVNYVTLIDHHIPIQTIEATKPHFHVKGGDYKAEDLATTPVVRKLGGEVVIIPLIAGHSTSTIIKRLIKQKPN